MMNCLKAQTKHFILMKSVNMWAVEANGNGDSLEICDVFNSSAFILWKLVAKFTSVFSLLSYYLDYIVI
jgi:hypothetical protein